MPVNFARLRNGRAGMVVVAAAGPLTNLALAVLSGMAARALLPMAGGTLGPESQCR